MIEKMLATALLAIVLCSGCATGKHIPVREAEPGIFVGAGPKTKHDFDVLRQHEVKTILNLECLPLTVLRERRTARKNGLEFRHVAIPAWPFEPSQRRIKKALLILHDQSLHPIFLHCY